MLQPKDESIKWDSIGAGAVVGGSITAVFGLIFAYVDAPLVGIGLAALTLIPGVVLMTLGRRHFTMLGVLFGVTLGAGVGALISIPSHLDQQRKREAHQAKQRHIKAKRDRQIARIPGLLAEANGFVAQKDWRSTRNKLQEIRTIMPEHPGATDLYRRVEPEIRRVDAADAAAQRKKEVLEGIQEAGAILASAEQCGIGRVISDAWRKLRQVQRGEPNFREVNRLVRRLERCRKKVARELRRGTNRAQTEARKKLARLIEVNYLDEGIDARVTVHGAKKDRIKIAWAAMSRAVAYHVAKDGQVFATLKRSGFRRVTFADGFGGAWYYDIEPAESPAEQALRGLDLHEPFGLE